MIGKVGIDNYSLFPLRLSPLDTLKWAKQHGAKGVAFSGLIEEDRQLCSRLYLHQLVAYSMVNGLYLEWGGAQHIPRDLTTWERKEIFDINLKAAQEAKELGVSIIRSCSGGLMRWNPDSLSTQQLLEETAEALLKQKQMLLDHKVILAIETHFEFTTFELLKLITYCDARPGEWLGICLDTMNLLTMLEDPILAAQRVLPWMVSTHIKDGCIRLTEEGFVSYPTRIGDGIVDISALLKLLKTQERTIHLSIEDHGGSFDIPIFNSDFRKEFPDLRTDELIKLLLLAGKTAHQSEKQKCHPVDRESWPNLCESAIIKDLKQMNRIVSKSR